MSEIPSKSSDRKYYMFALRIVGDFGATIAVPAVLAASLGVWLDNRFQTAPLLLSLCLLVSFVLTAKIGYKKSKKYGDDYQKL